MNHLAIGLLDQKRRVNQQVQNYKTCLKNSHFGVEKFNFLFDNVQAYFITPYFGRTV